MYDWEITQILQQNQNNIDSETYLFDTYVLHLFNSTILNMNHMETSLRCGVKVETIGNLQYTGKKGIRKYMITLIRFIILKQKEIKIKLAFYMFLDKQLKNFNSEEFMNKFMKEIASYIASMAHDEASKMRSAEKKEDK